MIGMVIVSHSAKLAEGVCDLARQVAQGRVRIARRRGHGRSRKPHRHRCVPGAPGHRVGLQRGRRAGSHGPRQRRAERRNRARAFGRASEARASSCAPLRWWKAPWRQPPWPPPAPALAEISLEARNALAGKLRRRLRLPNLETQACRAQAVRLPQARRSRALVTLTNPLGLHARPAAQLVRLARRYRAQVTHRQRRRPASINAVLAWGRAKATSCASARRRRSARGARRAGRFHPIRMWRAVALCATAHLDTRPAASRRPRASPSVRWSSCVPPPWKSPLGPSRIPRRSGNA